MVSKSAMRDEIAALEERIRALELRPGCEPKDGLIPAGVYPAEIVDVASKVSQRGRRVWTVQFRITEGEWRGRSVWDNHVERPPTPLEQMARSIGAHITPVYNDMPAYNESAMRTAMVGRMCRVRTEVRNFGDRDISGVVEVLRA